MTKLSGPLTKYPARGALLGYLLLIATGALVLWQPICQARPETAPITFLDAVFTSTSAVCVTGLTVRSTGHDFSLLGQCIIMLLIQIGGIGILTFTTFITLGLGSQTGLRQRAVVAETLGSGERENIGSVLRRVIAVVAVVEGIGFVVLAVRNLLPKDDVELSFFDAIWHALFHSVAAFCNAGFSLLDDSLVRYQGDPITSLTIAGLIVVGGLGFPVISDLRRNWHGPYFQRWDRLSLHTKLMLIGTSVLIVFGTLAFLLLEWENTLQDMPLWKRGLVSVFQSITTRTAGFNTVDVARLTDATLFIIILLMMVGAGPCSTGGGVKVATVVVLTLEAWSKFNGRKQVQIFRRTIPNELVDKAIAAVLLFSIVGAIALTCLLVADEVSVQPDSERGDFLGSTFEVISALGTVGLSTGATMRLDAVGRWIIIVLMFVGRLGPISAAVALSHGERDAHLSYPKEEVLVG